LIKTEFNESEELQMIYSQEEIKDKKGIDNVVADHLLKLTIDLTFGIPPINDSRRNQGQERHRQCCRRSFVKIDNRFDI
jgi:hypothetical protein